MVHFIPEELLQIVLSKLPVKSLLRLRCVSKLWLNIIDSSYFINMHLTQTAKTSTNTIIIPHEHKMMYAFDFDEENMSTDKARKIEPPVSSKDVHTCNGLISLSTDNTIVIWNPATHKHRVIDKVKVDGWSCPYNSFGYDHKTDDYKVMMLEFPKEDKGLIVYIYSLKTGSWREKIETSKSEIIKGTPYTSAYASNAIHWVDNYNVIPMTWESKCRIVSFDLTTEKWLPPTMPPELSETRSTYQNWSLSEHHGSLYACCSDEETNIVDFWVMEYQGRKNIWTKLLRMQGSHSRTKITPLWSLKKNSRHQLLIVDSKQHELYDIEEKTKEAFDVYGVHGISGILQSFICYETLVPI